jgi:hypothetical protein
VSLSLARVLPFLTQVSEALHDVPLGIGLLPAWSALAVKLQAKSVLVGCRVHPEAVTFDELHARVDAGCPEQVVIANVVL